MAAISGPPSAFALSMRPWLLMIFLVFVPVAVARFLVIDVIGGIFLLLTAGIGWYALKGSMDVSWLLCLAIILFLNGVFDAFILAARAMDTQYPLFGKGLTLEANLTHAILCAGPLFEFISAIMCWSIYRDHIGNLLGDEFMGMEGGDVTAMPVAAGALGLGNTRHILTGSRSSSSLAQPGAERRPAFEAFQGEPHKLHD